jgi:hypothetical protein
LIRKVTTVWRGDGRARNRDLSSTRDGALVRLLAAATATIDSDRDRAKACVQRATELLRVSLEREGHLRMDSSSRGGLAPWQAKRVVAYIESNISLSFRVATSPASCNSASATSLAHSERASVSLPSPMSKYGECAMPKSSCRTLESRFRRWLLTAECATRPISPVCFARSSESARASGDDSSNSSP